jgi:hypothetical protein
MIILFLFLLVLFLPLVLKKENTFSIHCLSFLGLRGRRLDLSLALVVGRGDTGERVGFLLLYFWPESACGRYPWGGAEIERTLRYSLEASCHSRVMVCGAGLANMRMVAKMVKEAPRPART